MVFLLWCRNVTRYTDGPDVAAGQELIPTAGGVKNNSRKFAASPHRWVTYIIFYFIPLIHVTQNMMMMRHDILRDQNPAFISHQKERIYPSKSMFTFENCGLITRQELVVVNFTETKLLHLTKVLNCCYLMSRILFYCSLKYCIVRFLL